MNPEPANCPICRTAAERCRRRSPNGFIYTCPHCGVFEVAPAALTHTDDFPGHCLTDVRRLRDYGYRPRIDFKAGEGVRIAPACQRG